MGFENRPASSEDSLIRGEGSVVSLRPAEPLDRKAVYEWLAQSDITSSMFGSPLFPETRIPSWEEFCEDYNAHFWDGSKPERGRSFIIVVHEECLGHVNYDVEDRPHRLAELDIWLRSSKDCGHGYGSEALRILVGYLREAFGFTSFLLRPSARNAPAIHAYEKAGFVRVAMSPDEMTTQYGRGDYFDTVIMRRDLGS